MIKTANDLSIFVRTEIAHSSRGHNRRSEANARATAEEEEWLDYSYYPFLLLSSFFMLFSGPQMGVSEMEILATSYCDQHEVAANCVSIGGSLFISLSLGEQE